MSENPVVRRRSVFISYASADDDRATLVRMHLEHEGISCWMAPRDIPSGQRYAEAILGGIEQCDVFLLLFSQSANSSSHVLNEVEEGASRNKAILVVRTDDADPGANRSVSLFLRSHQWFDATKGPLTVHIGRIAGDVQRLVERVSAERAVADDPHPDLSIAVPPVDASPARATSRPRGGRRSIGIEVDPMVLRACVTDLADPEGNDDDVVVQMELPASARHSRGVLEAVRAMAHRVVDEHFPDAPPAGIGLAVPGQVDLRAGTLKFGPNLFGARNLPFKTHLNGEFPRVPVRVDNDVRCATRAELHLGIGRQFDSFVCLFVGAGVGSGSVVDRRIHFGHNFCAGEIGHTKISQSGPPCACGQIGCLETFVKAQAIVDRATAKGIDWESRGRETLLKSDTGPLTPDAVVEAIEAGDAGAMEIASEVGRSLGLGIANYLNLVNPAAIVVGGALMTGFFFHMIEGITESVQRNTLAEVANTPIVQSAHSEDGLAVGASLMFHDDDGWPFP